MSIKNIGIGKYNLEKITFNTFDKELEKNTVLGKFHLNFSSNDEGDNEISSAHLELNIINSKYELELEIAVPLNVESDKKIMSADDLEKGEEKIVMQPLLSKASELVSYITGNAFPLPEILVLDFDNIEILKSDN